MSSYAIALHQVPFDIYQGICFYRVLNKPPYYGVDYTQVDTVEIGIDYHDNHDVHTFLRTKHGDHGRFQYLIRRHVLRSRKVSKARDRVLEWSYWQTLRQQCCKGACQISQWSYNAKYKSSGFESLWDLIIRRLIRYWNRAPLLKNNTLDVPITIDTVHM